MRVIDIVPGTSVDGPGLRTAIYFSGCTHHCPGCQNPQSWDLMSGKDMSIDDILFEIEENGFDVTFSGGDPLCQLDDLVELARRIKDTGKAIWCYTGYIYETVANDPEKRRILDYVDVLVDGPFIEELKDKDLLFKGSSNQRLIDVTKSTAENPVLWDGETFTAVL